MSSDTDSETDLHVSKTKPTYKKSKITATKTEDDIATTLKGGAERVKRDKRKDEKENLKYELTSDKKKILLPEIKTLTASGKEQIWQLQIELIKKGTEVPIVIRPEYFNNKSLEDIAARYRTYKKIIKDSYSEYKTIKEGLNIGKKNATNVLTQVLSVCKSKHLDYIEKHPPIDKKKTSDIPRVIPMLLKEFSQVRLGKLYKVNPKIKKKIDAIFESKGYLIGQRKLDGIRTIVTKIKGNIRLFSRTMKEYENDNIKSQLESVFNEIEKKYPDKIIFLDGEQYKFGERLQDISSKVRKMKGDEMSIHELKSGKVEYHIFDAFEFTSKDSRKSKTTLAEGQKILDNLTISGTLIKREENFIIKTFDDIEKYTNTFIKEGYEGLILRFPDENYTYGIGGLHCDAAVKVKGKFTDEWEVVGFTQGDGKYKGVIMWTIKKGDVQFNCDIADTIANRKKLYKLVSKGDLFEKKIKGQKVTIEYEDLSKDGVPLRAKAVAIRDYE
jgi:DNA-directed RNA polymerase subunit F